MKNACLLFLLLFSALDIRAGQYFYWVDFDSPLNTINEIPATNAGPRTPSRIVFGNPTVVSSFGQLTNQPLHFKGTYYEQIQFDLGRNVPDYFIEFDLETRNLNPSLFLYAVVFDLPGATVFYFHGLGYIGVPPANSSYLPGWSENELQHVSVKVDVPNGVCVFKLDDRPPEIRQIFYPREDVFSIRLNLSPWHGSARGDTNVQVAIDNVRIGTSMPAGPPTIDCSGPLTLECTGSDPATLFVTVEDSSTSPLSVIWFVDGTPYQTNSLAAGTALTPTNLTFTAYFEPGEHLVVVSASNGEAPAAACSKTLTVRDTTPPVVAGLSATPALLWPPNGTIRSVRIHAEPLDNCGVAVCRIVDVQSSEMIGSSDWEITGELTLKLRADRSARGPGRTYTVIIRCEDSVGNTSLHSVAVEVPRDQKGQSVRP